MSGTAHGSVVDGSKVNPEGGRDPLGRFDDSLEGVSGAAHERFYSGNFAEMMGMVSAGS